MKKTEKNLYILCAVFAALLVCSNCIAAKQIPIGKWFGLDIAITAGIICYPLTFLVTDIIGEIWGKGEAKKAVIGGFIGQVIAVLLIILANLLPSSDPSMKTMFNSVLGSNWILIISSLTACILSQTWDVWIFHKIRNAYIKRHGSTEHGKWIWNNIGTITSQFIDSAVFYVGVIIMLATMGINLTFSEIVVTVFAYWVIKIVIALLDTFVFYFFTRKADKR